MGSTSVEYCTKKNKTKILKRNNWLKNEEDNTFGVIIYQNGKDNIVTAKKNENLKLTESNQNIKVMEQQHSIDQILIDRGMRKMQYWL